ncbi:MAG: M28 family peptidase [Chloroflexi bacterium]|nr:M28 family peptidase [Chloroflexota bacterium]
MSDIALKHIEYLSVTVGPRGTATDKEREAHDYVENTLKELGYETHRDSLQVAPSIYPVFILALFVMLVAVWLFYQFNAAGALAASALGIIVAVSTLMELALNDNPLRWFLPVAPSQNVYAVAKPAGEAQKKIVVAAHVDTHRTPLIWASPGMYTVYRVLSTLGMVGLPVGAIVFVVGIFVTNDFLRQIALGLAVLDGLLLLMVLQAEFTKHTAGANDNASGVGVMLSLAARLKREPLADSEVWFVATAAEETGAYGMSDFVRRHEDELDDDTTFLILDSIGGKDTGPCWLRSEMFLLPLNYPARTLGLAEKIAADRPDLGAYSWTVQGAYSDGAIALKEGFDALTLMNYTKKGSIPNLHQPGDTFDRVDPGVVDRTEEFAWEVVRRVDRG